ncbi:class I SAM-dependent methyltransferase [Planctomycetota bacterium]
MPEDNGCAHSGKDPRREFFDRHAANWDKGDPKWGEMFARFEEISELLELARGENVLDVGCGTGDSTGWLGEKVHPGAVTGIDFSEKMLARARAKNIPAEFRVSDVCNDNLGEGLYDVIFCFQCFPHFRDRVAALGNFARAMKAGGRLIILHLAGSSAINRHHGNAGGVVAGDYLPEAGEWDKLLAGAGLRKTRLIDRDNLYFLKAVGEKHLAPGSNID